MPHLPSRTTRAYRVVCACIDWVYELMMEVVLRVISYLYHASVEHPMPDIVEHAKVAVMPEAHAAPMVEHTRVITEGVTLFISEPRVAVYRSNGDDFDGRIGYVHYGESGTVRTVQESAVFLDTGRLSGWVDIRACTATETASCFPFSGGVVYDAAHPCTRSIRMILNDPFGLSETERPLTGAEYVLYQWYEMGKEIVWPPIRPRTPGMWHQILRMSTTTHVTLEPSRGAIMEYMDATGRGHLAFVRDISTDGTLCLEEVGEEADGVYTALALTFEMWNTRSPIFITNAMFDNVS